MSSYTFSRTSERPTLPPIHTLDLPFLSRQPRDGAYESYDKSSRSIHAPHTRHHGLRKASTSSSNTSASRSPSPVLSPPSSRESSPNTSAGSKLRLVPCSLEEADAVILVPSPASPYTPLTAGTPLKDAQPGQPLLLVGSAVQQLRQPQRPLTKGARMHPYRIVNGPHSRRSSIASMVSLPVSS